MPDFKLTPSVNSVDVATVEHVHPADGPPDGLTVWLDAGQLTGLADGGAVTTWPDASGNGHNVGQTGGLRPLYKSGAANGRPAVRFDGTNDYLVSAAPLNGGTIAQPYTYVLAHKFSSTAGAPRLFGFDAVLYVDSGVYTMWAGAVLSSAIATDATDWHVLTGIFNGASSFMYLDGTQIATGNAGSSSNSWLHVGADAGGFNPFPGDVAEALIYNRALAPAERRQLETSLAFKYGVGVPAASGFATAIKWGTD